jgi:sugar phosphate isomerase/epimerase
MTPMKLAIQDVLLPGATLADKWGFARDTGFDGIELWARGGEAFRAMQPDLRAARRQGAVFSTACVIMDHFIGDFDPDRRASARDSMKTLLSVIADVGGKGAITPAAYGLHSNYLPPFTAPRSAAEDRAILVDTLGELGDHAAGCGVQLLFEPLNRYEDHMCNSLAQGVDLLRAVNHPAVRLMADLFHMSIEESDSPAALRAAGALVAHVHLADNTRREPSTGSTDFAACFRALRDAGFDGWLAVECILSGPAETALPPSAAHLRAVLAP